MRRRLPRRAAKVAFITSVTSSAPARPWLESFSDIAVKPEMSMNETVPSTSRQSASGSFRNQSIVRRGTNETRSAEADDGEAAAVTQTFCVSRPQGQRTASELGRQPGAHGTFTAPQRNPPRKGTSDTS